MSGVVAAVTAQVGDRVTRGQQLGIVEAMKMQHALLSPRDGVVSEVHANVGRTTKAGAPLFLIAEERKVNKAVVTCALTGVLTDPAVYPAPVTPPQMAAEARRATDAGASVIHVHFRDLAPGRGHLPSWEPEVAVAVIAAHPRGVPGRHHQPDDGRRRLRHLRAVGVPARGQAGDRGAQCGFAQLSEDPRGRLVGVEADGV